MEKRVQRAMWWGVSKFHQMTECLRLKWVLRRLKRKCKGGMATEYEHYQMVILKKTGILIPISPEKARGIVANETRDWTVLTPPGKLPNPIEKPKRGCLLTSEQMFASMIIAGRCLPEIEELGFDN